MLRITNPFLWQAHELIFHANKLQWRVRQTRAHATLKLMVRRVCFARGNRSALSSAEAAEARVVGRAPPQPAVCRKDPRLMAFLSVNHFSRAPLLGTSPSHRAALGKPGCPRAGASSSGGRSGPRGSDDSQEEEASTGPGRC